MTSFSFLLCAIAGLKGVLGELDIEVGIVGG